MMSKSVGSLKPSKGNVTSGHDGTGPWGVSAVTSSKSQECWG